VRLKTQAIKRAVVTLQGMLPMQAIDYQSHNLLSLPEKFAGCFPNVATRKPWNPRIAQTGRMDRRWPNVGITTWDEATLLYNYSKMFAGKRALEIGCWIGWSSVAFALGGVHLDIIDPLVEVGTPQGDSVRESLTAAGVLDRVTFHPGFSPGKIREVGQTNAPWSLVFIDGNHEGDAPLNDARAVLDYCADTCAVIFHDCHYANIRALTAARILA